MLFLFFRGVILSEEKDPSAAEIPEHSQALRPLIDLPSIYRNLYYGRTSFTSARYWKNIAVRQRSIIPNARIKKSAAVCCTVSTVSRYPRAATRIPASRIITAKNACDRCAITVSPSRTSREVLSKG